jgi:hypothetical protein
MSRNKFTISSIVNIDCSFRNKTPKNIFKSDNRYLPLNPLNLNKGSSMVTINYPNHNLLQGDNIIIQNVEGTIKILSNSIYLVNNFRYAVIIIDTQVPSDYLNYTNEMYINIEIVGSQTENNFIDNIHFNNLVGYKKCFLASDIPSYYLQTFQNLSTQVFGTFDTNILNQKCFFIELPSNYINKTQSYKMINQTFKISYQHIGGIKLGYLNANYPINNVNYQSNYQVYSVIDENTFQINLFYQSFSDISGGGKNVQVMKITNTITGYPDADNYVIDLKKTFNNVVGIELISSEFPYVDVAIKKDHNDKLYWRNIEDGQYVYVVQLNEGFYKTDSLLQQLSLKMNQIPRVSSSKTDPIYNSFDIILEANIQKITFKPYNINNLPNSLSIRIEVIDNVKYYILNVGQPNSMVETNDIINISDSDIVTFKLQQGGTTTIYAVDAVYINGNHQVYLSNPDNQTYDIILGKDAEIKTVVVSSESNGGENIKIKSKSSISMLFDKPDTMGDILGFINPGDKYSVTNYSSIVSNTDPYAYSVNSDVVGNPYSYSSGFINLAGKYNYMLMYLNDIEYIFSNNNLPSAFSKIAFSGNPGDVLFNTYVPYPINVYSKNFPISTLTQLTIKFIYPDGSRVNFRNIDHSFTLRITEEKLQNSNTYLNSQVISVAEEFTSAKLND